jgi:hypothetical protein
VDSTLCTGTFKKKKWVITPLIILVFNGLKLPATASKKKKEKKMAPYKNTNKKSKKM